MILFAQSREIQGVVKDENGQPLPGASIMVSGSNQGGSTDFDGVFKFSINENAKEIVVSFIGFLDKTVVLSESNIYAIILNEDSTSLDEVVVVGYGTQRKSDLTGAVTSIKVDETAAQQSSTVDQLLQGRAAGVQVIQNGGSPGSGVSVRIRGASSLRGNNEPLYVVDGVIIASAGEDTLNAGGGNDLQESQNGLNGINPRDIESMEVLKDASATAIYGSRGANGVILITTKKGKSGRTTISGYVSSSVTEIDKKLDMLNGVEYANYINEAALLNGNAVQYHVNNGEVYPISNEDGTPIISDIPARQVNWQDEIYKLGLSNSLGVSFSGGSDKGNFYISTGYSNQGGIVENSNFQKGNFSIKVSQNLSSRLKVDAKLSAFYAEGNFAQDGDRAGGGNRSFTNNILTYRPLVGVGDDGFDEDLGNGSPYTWIDDFEDLSEETRFVGSLGLTYKFNVEGLSYKFQAGGNMRSKERRRYYGLETFVGKATNGELRMSNLTSKSYQINNLLNYTRKFNRKHRVNAVAGVTYDVRDNLNSVYSIADFSSVVFGADSPNLGQLVTQPYNLFPSKTQLLSYLTRVNYTYDNKYVFTGSYRIDGSSKFSEENRYSAFPSFSLAWRANKEKFLDNADFLSDLKLRAGWGMTGNQAINPYQTFANYGGVAYATEDNGTQIGFAPLNIANPNLIWETTTQINIGLDFGFLNNRVSGNIDVYSKETEDLLQLERLPPSAGFGSLLINRGSLKSEGIELTLGGTVIDKKDFSLELGGNIAFNKNEITNLGNAPSEIYIDGELQERAFYLGDNVSTGTYFKAPANIFIEGEAIGLFYGYQTDGIYQTGDQIDLEDYVAGDVKHVDLNGDGKIDGADRTIIGDPNPDFIYGGYVNMNYKRLSLNVLMNGVSGNEIMNGTNVRIDYAEGQANNIRREAYAEAWRPDAPSTTYPRVGYKKEAQALAVSDRQVEDGSYFRISNVTLAFDLPVENSNVFSRANIYLSGNNLLTITDYSGYNPEITSFMNNGNILGTEWNGYPNARTFTLGINLDF